MGDRLCRRQNRRPTRRSRQTAGIADDQFQRPTSERRGVEGGKVHTRNLVMLSKEGKATNWRTRIGGGCEQVVVVASARSRLRRREGGRKTSDPGLPSSADFSCRPTTHEQPPPPTTTYASQLALDGVHVSSLRPSMRFVSNDASAKKWTSGQTFCPALPFAPLRRRLHLHRRRLLTVIVKHPILAGMSPRWTTLPGRIVPQLYDNSTGPPSRCLGRIDRPIILAAAPPRWRRNPCW